MPYDFASGFDSTTLSHEPVYTVEFYTLSEDACHFEENPLLGLFTWSEALKCIDERIPGQKLIEQIFDDESQQLIESWLVSMNEPKLTYLVAVICDGRKQ